MDHDAWPPLTRQRCRRFRKARIEKAARRRRGEAERVLHVRFLDYTPMIRKRRNRRRAVIDLLAVERYFRPIGLEAEFAVRVGEALEIMRGGEVRLAIDPSLGFEVGKRPPAGLLQRDVDQFA